MHDFDSISLDVHWPPSHGCQSVPAGQTSDSQEGVPFDTVTSMRTSGSRL